MKIDIVAVSIIFMLIISGCAKQPTYLDLIIESHNNINTDSDNVASPLMLNFYELSSTERFSKLDYWTLMENGEDKLSNDLISQNKQVIIPNEEQLYRILFDDKAKFLGIIGNFRNIDVNSTWRYIINLEQNEYNWINVEIDNYTIKAKEVK